MSSAAAWLAAGALLTGLGCPGNNPARPPERPAGTALATRPDLRVTDHHPPVAVVTREGDPYPALGIAVVTSGLAPTSVAALSLAALAATRLVGSPDVTVAPAFDGYRIRVPLRQGASAVAAFDAARGALLAPVRDAEIAPVQARIERSTRVADAASLPVWACRGEPFVVAPPPAATTASLEAMRKAAHGVGRVTVAIVGPQSITEPLATKVTTGDPWPEAARAAPADLGKDTAAVVPSQDPRSTTVSVALWTARASQAAAAATLLDRGTLGTRLGLLDAPARLRDLTAVAHPTGGCVVVDIDLQVAELAEGGLAKIAAAAALVEEDVAIESRHGDEAQAALTARQGRDPEEAAERAAWWAASVDNAAAGSPFTLVAETGEHIKREDLEPAMRRARADLAGAVVEKKSKSEPGQGELWLLLGSPCGTSAESMHDAGFAAVVVHAATRRRHDDVEIEPWVAPEGVGVLVHGPQRKDESAEVHARRLADVAGRAIAMFGRDPEHLKAAQVGLLRTSELDAARAFTQLALALSPGHPAWVQPLGSADALTRASQPALAARARALLSGPVRVAVLGSGESQADSAAKAIDRWLVRRPGEARSCSKELAAKPRPGTYAVERVVGGPAEVFIAAPLPTSTDPHLAGLLAAELDGEEGPLALALGASAREWSVRVVGRRESLAVVVRVSGLNQALDGAVEKVRGVLGKARSLDAADLARARRVRVRARELELRNPARRVASLFAGDLDDRARDATESALRGLAQEAFRDEGLVMIALRAPATSDRRATP